MKEYKKPILVEEKVEIEDIVATSALGEKEGDVLGFFNPWKN